MTPTNRKTGTAIGIALLCTAAFTASGAFAAPAQDYSAAPSLHLSYDETLLYRPGGAQLLYRRIEGAARRVCHEPDMRELVRYAQYQQCFHQAVDAAVAEVNVTTLTAHHHSKTQRTAAG
jgi:UrcA family protein